MGGKDKGKSNVGHDYENTTSGTHGKSPDKGKEVWEDEAAAAALIDCFSFSGRRRDTSLFLGIMPPQLQDGQSSEVLTDHQEVPTDVDAKGRTDLELLLSDEYLDLPQVVPQDTTSNSSPSCVEAPNMSWEDNNVIEATELKHPSSSSSRRAPMSFAETVALHQALVRAWFDPDQRVPYKLIRESLDALKEHYAADVEKFYRNPSNASAPELGRISNFYQIQHPGSGLNSRNSEFQSVLRQIKYPSNHAIRLINIKGHVLTLSVDPYGSRFIQQKLGIATTGEIMMVYKEITPHVLTLAVDGFANYAIQKLLEHGPPFCKKELVVNLIGHVFGLSLDMYGCRVIQKAFEQSEIDLQIEMAKELDSNLLKCVHDQHANHVVQKCIECVPPQYIQFIFTSLCGQAKILSSHPYGCHVIQKALEFCKDPQILHAFVLEIADCVNELSAHQFGNYVVQYILEHEGAQDRQFIVLKFAGRIVQMSYQKHSSNVIEKCLIYGSYYDRQMITTEILHAGGGQIAHHLVSMMVHQYANYVVQKMIETADEWQFNVIVDVVRCNVSVLAMYTHGRHVIAQVERLLSARAGFFVSLAAPPHIAG